MIDLSSYQIREITEYMFLPDVPLKADATIVLGQTLWHRPFQKSIEIYRSGLSGKLIFTGGFNPKIGNHEALCMKRAWIEMGYCADDFLIDTEATNTMENMQNAKALMEKAELLRSGVAINLITINYHMRRAAETLKYVFADKSLQLGIINYPSKYCEPDTWFDDQQGRSLVLNEFTKIKKYLGIC